MHREDDEKIFAIRQEVQQVNKLFFLAAISCTFSPIYSFPNESRGKFGGVDFVNNHL